jgi:ubiquinone/menaquinone biosynthesis C-methylase UbiE
MNEQHLRLCSSAEWAAGIKANVMAWLDQQADLGDDVIEVGPGPGVTTDELRQRVPRLLAVEFDDTLAASLAERLRGTNVTVLHADASALPCDSGRFSGATCFYMLHHVPSADKQDQVLAELARVLRPGGVFLGVDSIDRPTFRELHENDICVLVDPATISSRLERAGFEDIQVSVEQNLRWSARRAATPAAQ